MIDNDIEIFNRAFRQYGGRLDFVDVDAELTTQLNDWRNLFTKLLLDVGYEGAFPPGTIYLDYVDNPAINAIASKSQGRELIGLFAGASGLVMHCFSVLSVLPDAYGGAGRVIEGLSPREVGRLIETPTRRYLDFPGERDGVRSAIAQAAEMIVHFSICS